MPLVLRIMLLNSVLLTACSTAIAKEDPAKIDKSPGLEVGSKAPDFTLKDQDGKDVKLTSLLKKGPVAVVFHRSAQW